jgi:iron complex transport system ATP-binding protein
MRLEIDRLSFGYPGRIVGRGVGFSIEAGEIVCLLGPNGGGKTTLFKTILGLVPPHGGAVRIDGEDISAWPRQRLARAIAFVPQTHAAYFPFRVRDVVVMGRSAHLGIFAAPGRRDREAAEAALERLGIGHLADRPYTEVSGGERQLALLARALVQEARIVIMDEPTASLDFGNQVRALATIAELAADGLGVLFSTHDPDHAFLCADRVALLHDGRLLRFGPPREALTPATLRTVYGVDVAVVEIDQPLATLAVPIATPVSPRRTP